MEAKLLEHRAKVRAVDLLGRGESLAEGEEHLGALGIVHDHHRSLARLDEYLTNLVGDEHVELVAELHLELQSGFLLVLGLAALGERAVLSGGDAPELTAGSPRVHAPGLAPLVHPALEVLLLGGVRAKNANRADVRPPVHHDHLARQRGGLSHVEVAELRNLVGSVEVPLRHLAGDEDGDLGLVPSLALHVRRAGRANLVGDVHHLARLLARGKHPHLGHLVESGNHHRDQRLSRVVGADDVADVGVHLLDERVLRRVVRLTHGALAGGLEHVGAANLVDDVEEDPVTRGLSILPEPRGVALGGGADEVLEVRAGESRALPRDQRDVEVGVDHALEDLIRAVKVDDVHAGLSVGEGHLDHAVKAAGSDQRRVDDVRPVRRGEHHHAAVAAEAVHLGKELVDGGHLLVVALHRRRVLSAHGDRVKLVDEDDARAALARLVEEVANARRAHAHEHLHELGARAREEGHLGLARQAPGEQSLARSRGSAQEDAHGDGRTRPHVPLIIAEVGDELVHLLADHVDARDVVHVKVLLRGGAVRLRRASVHQRGTLRGVLPHIIPDDPDERQQYHRRSRVGQAPEEQL